MPPICEATSTGSGRSVCRRENARSCLVRLAPRWAAWTHAVHEPATTVRIGLAVEHVEAAGDHHQQIVEVVRHAAGQLSDGFDLLGLPKRLLDAGTLVHLDAQLLVGFLKGPRALDHQRLELLGRLLARLRTGRASRIGAARARSAA